MKQNKRILNDGEILQALSELLKLPKKCKVRGYTGKRAPKCCGGSGCQECWLTYIDARREAIA